MFKIRNAVGAMPWLVLAASPLANAACECGYSVNKTTDAQYSVFTDLHENDFLHSSGDNLTEFGWKPQEFNVSAKLARGPYGKDFWVDNVELNPLKEASAWSGESDKGGDAGLKLWVRGDHSGGFVSGAEMASVRDDALYGSFRVGMKLAAESGTCGAFFWYFDNTQEIDMEFLSKDFNASRGAVNLVLQSHEAESHGNDASNTSTYKIQPLQFRPDNAFHEYRFDWTPDRVTFFVDGSPVQTFTENVPTSGGTFFMNHWSNGDKGWSAGPPGNDTAMTVSYVKAYFNSTDTERQGKFEKRCKEWDPEKVCAIPEQKGMPDGEVGAQTYFFSEDGGDKTPGQIVFKHSNGAAGMCASSPLALCVSMVVALLTALVL